MPNFEMKQIMGRTMVEKKLAYNYFINIIVKLHMYDIQIIIIIIWMSTNLQMTQNGCAHIKTPLD